jgi:hypothetical protein
MAPVSMGLCQAACTADKGLVAALIGNITGTRRSLLLI